MGEEEEEGEEKENWMGRIKTSEEEKEGKAQRKLKIIIMIL